MHKKKLSELTAEKYIEIREDLAGRLVQLTAVKMGNHISVNSIWYSLQFSNDDVDMLELEEINCYPQKHQLFKRAVLPAFFIAARTLGYEYVGVMTVMNTYLLSYLLRNEWEQIKVGFVGDSYRKHVSKE